MAQIEIPSQWRTKVCAILATEETGTRIRWTGDAQKRYQAVPGCLWTYEVYQSFRDYLEKDHATGCRCTMENPPGETYEFFFQFKGRRLYGKILLKTDHKSVVIFSAHLPNKSKLSCE